jgi:integrase
MKSYRYGHLASTNLSELGVNADAIEKQLAHVDGSTRGVYNKAEMIDERTKLIFEWADFIKKQAHY